MIYEDLEIYDLDKKTQQKVIEFFKENDIRNQEDINLMMEDDELCDEFEGKIGLDIIDISIRNPYEKNDEDFIYADRYGLNLNKDNRWEDDNYGNDFDYRITDEDLKRTEYLENVAAFWVLGVPAIFLLLFIIFIASI